jgi:hypothetical protein
MLTLKTFLRIIEEDTTTDQQIMQIQTALSQIDTRINQAVAPLQRQKSQLQQQLMPLMKKKQADDVKLKGQQAQSNVNQQGQPMMRTGTTTPGGTGNATPGSTGQSTPGVR